MKNNNIQFYNKINRQNIAKNLKKLQNISNKHINQDRVIHTTPAPIILNPTIVATVANISSEPCSWYN